MLFHLRRYKLLLAQVDAAERNIAKVVDQQRHLHAVLTQQQTQHEQEIAVLRETFTNKIAHMCEVVDLQHSQHKSLIACLDDSQHRLDQLRDEFSANLALIGNQEEQTRHRLQEIAVALTEHRQAVEQVTQLLSTHTERQADTLREQRKEIEALLAQHTRNVGDALQTLNQDGATALAAVTQRVEQVEGKRPQLVSKKAQARKVPAPQATTLPAQRSIKQHRKSEG